MADVSDSLARAEDGQASRRILCFLDIELDVPKAELRRAGGVMSISALSLSLLDYLIRHRERVVSRDELGATLFTQYNAVGRRSHTRSATRACAAPSPTGIGRGSILTAPATGSAIRGCVPAET